MYGVDLRDALWGSSPIGGRRLIVFVEQLPQTSATWRSINDGWTQQDEMLASIFDLLGMTYHLTLAVNSKKGAKLPEPARFPRPWDNKEDNMPRAHSSMDEVRALFGTMADDPSQVVVR